MVDDGISVDTDAERSASLDHVAELLTGSTTASQFVGSWLVVEPPWVEFAALRPLVGEDRFRNWEDPDAHPALLGQVLALLLDVLMRPAEHLDDGTLLTALVDTVLVNSGALPSEVDSLNSHGEFFAVSIDSLGSQSKSIVTKGAAGLIGGL